MRMIGAEIEKRTKVACAAAGLGIYSETEDTVKDAIHKSCSDQAANMKNAWIDFDGDECVCHALQCSVKKFLHYPGTTTVEKRAE